jgi:hypothetical protein
MYRRTMGRLWKSTFVLALLLGSLWMVKQFGAIQVLRAGAAWVDLLIFAAALMTFGICVFAFIAQRLAFVQAHTNYFSIVTPFLRLKVSYRRIQKVHPELIQNLFPKSKARWAERNFLEPFYGKTSVVIETRGYPMNPAMLRLFLPAQMFSPRTTGFVLLVSDWMKFSTELDSFQGAWLQSQGSQRLSQGSPGKSSYG